MSKFFAAAADGDVSSSEEEDLYGVSVEESESMSEDLSNDGSDGSESESDSDAGSDEDSDAASRPRPQYLRNQFLKGQGSDSSDEDSSEDNRKVVKSAKDKVLDEVDAAAKAVESGKKSSEWIAATASFDRLLKAAEKVNRQYSVVPLSLVQCLADLEGTVPEEIKTARRNLPPSQSKALNTLNQRLKKALKEYGTRVQSYCESPDDYTPESGFAAQLASGSASQRDSPVPGISSAEAVDNELTSESVFKTLLGIVETRGKKNTDRAEQITVLEKLLTVSKTPYQKISVLLMLIPVRFDATSSGSIMPLASWKAIDRNIRALFDVLEQDNNDFIVIESATEPEDFEKGPAPGPHGYRLIPGSISSLVERLDDEHTRALQVIDPHTTEYIERLRDETSLYDLFLRSQAHIERNFSNLGIGIKSSEALSRLLVRRLDHIYYKPTNAIVTAEIDAWKRVPSQLNSQISPRLSEPPQDPQQYTIDLISSLCKVLYNQQNIVFRARAMLGLVYHYALNDCYNKARDLMLMSHLQSTIQSAEPMVQVLFNRALVQVGLCAFRLGLVPEALQSLQEICSSSRLRELLGQATGKFGFNSSGPDRSQILPFHMHINLELIECVYLTSSLLIEVPYLAGLRHSADLKKKIISKPFRRMLDYHDRQVFNGPSENTRDHIIQAAKFLQQGDWRKANDLLASIKVWSLLSGTDKIMSMLREKLQQEGLRTYLMTYGSSYGWLSIQVLSKLFELPVTVVRSIVTKMIAHDEIAAAFDETSEYVTFNKSADYTRLQTLSLALADKTMTLSERNERLAGDGHGSEQSSNKPTAKKTAGRSQSSGPNLRPVRA